METIFTQHDNTTLHLVIRLMSAVYVRQEFKDPTLSREALIQQGKDESARLKFRVCVVFSEHDAVYVEPDGTVSYQGDPPNGGVLFENVEIGERRPYVEHFSTLPKKKYGTGVTAIFNSIIIKYDVLQQKYPGGYAMFEETYRGTETDRRLISVCYMGGEWEELVSDLQKNGLHSTRENTDFYMLADNLGSEIDFCSFNDGCLDITLKKRKSRGFIVRLKE